jgi:hypothetical protein
VLKNVLAEVIERDIPDDYYGGTASVVDADMSWLLA